MKTISKSGNGNYLDDYKVDSLGIDLWLSIYLTDSCRQTVAPPHTLYR